MDLLEALLLAACFAVIEIPVFSFQIPHFEVTIESLIHVLIRNDPRKENRIFIRCFILKTHSIFLQCLRHLVVGWFLFSGIFAKAETKTKTTTISNKNKVKCNVNNYDQAQKQASSYNYSL